MLKLHYFSLVTIVTILGLNSTTTLKANASVVKKTNFSRSEKVEAKLPPQNTILAFDSVAQKSSDSKKSSQKNEDMETIEQIQKRDKKLEAFKDMLRIDGIVPEVSQESEDSIDTGDEMMDAIQKRQNRIKNLQELKILQDKFDREKLKELEKENINLKNAEELEELRGIINNENLDDAEILETLQKKNIDIESAEKLQKIQKLVNTGNPRSAVAQPDSSDKLSATTAFRIFTIGIPATILVFFVATPFVKGTFGVVKDNVDEKFGKPKVPEGSITLHNKALQEITAIGNKAEKINDDKFGNEEFRLLLQIKIDIAKGTKDYKKFGYGVELLKAAIVAQKSFLKLESTELRYRSRKQQEFYRYVADNLKEDIDKEAFAKQVKKKQAEILPLINTEEGRSALESYIKEINNISKYELGLKLLALFKKYDLKDFSVLKKVSDVVERLQGQDLLSPKDLISLVLENYDAFEKLAPILDIPESELSPNIYARMLQFIGLENRHGKSYLQFKQLVELLKKWEKPYKTIKMVRKEYTSNKYQIPSEFEQQIPGKDVYQKYAEYLPDL